MKIFNIRRLGLALIVGGLLLVIPFLQARAMTVSPVRLELSGDPGTTVGGFFKVINEENEAKTLYTSFENFEAMGESGSPNFVKTGEGLATWLNAPKEITVGPGETKVVDFAITIPASAEPGGYFAAIFLGTNPPSQDQSQLSIGARIGTLVLFRVNGDIEEGGALLEFGTKNQKKWFSALPINLYYRFQNTGADRVLPKGNLEIKNIFGQTVKNLNPNPTQGSVLPRSIRRFEVWWQKGDSEGVPTEQSGQQGFFEAAAYQWNNFALGRYTANLGIVYGTSNDNAVANFSFFVLPWQLLTIIILAIVITWLLLRFIIKRYNRFIIKRARS